MGRAGVEFFLREGAKVAAVDVNAEALTQLKADMAKGYELITIQAICQTEQMKSSINDAAARLAASISWANAGGTPRPAGVENLDLKAWNSRCR